MSDRNIVTAQPTRLPLQLFQLFVYFGESLNCEFQVVPRMCGGDLRADARGAMWNDRIKETNHVNAFLQHASGELLRFCSVADHDRDDRMHAGLDR